MLIAILGIGLGGLGAARSRNFFSCFSIRARLPQEPKTKPWNNGGLELGSIRSPLLWLPSLLALLLPPPRRYALSGAAGAAWAPEVVLQAPAMASPNSAPSGR